MPTTQGVSVAGLDAANAQLRPGSLRKSVEQPGQVAGLVLSVTVAAHDDVAPRQAICIRNGRL